MLSKEVYGSIDAISPASEPDVHDRDVRVLSRGGFKGFFSRNSDTDHIKASLLQRTFKSNRYEVIVFHYEDARASA
jgi:hypothetical protein